MLALLQEPPAGIDDSFSLSLFWKNAREEEWDKLKGFGVYGECHEYFKESKQDKTYPHYSKLLEIQKMITDQALKQTCKTILFATRREYL